MTVRLSALFEEQMRSVLSSWKSARRRNNNAKSKAKKKGKTQKGKHKLSNGTGWYLLLHCTNV